MKIRNITSNYYPKQQNRSNSSFKAIKGLGPDFGKNIQELAELITQNRELFGKFNVKLTVLNEKFTQISKLKKKLKIKAQMNLKEELAKLTQEIKSAVGLSKSTDATKKVSENNAFKPTTHNSNVVKGFGMGKIAGYEETKKILDEYFISKIKLEKEGKDVDIPSAFFFFGPKGNGKTTSAMAIAEETGCNISKLLFSKNLETPEEFFNKILKIAENTKNKFNEKGRTIIFSDEFTTYMSPEMGIKDKLLNFLKDCSQKYKCTFFGTTNHLSKAGEEIKSVNPVIVSFDPPSKRDMAEVLKYYVNGKEAEPINYYKLASEMQKWVKEQNKALTNADIKRLVKDTNLQLYTAKDLLNYLKNEYQEGSKLLSKDGLQNYIQDYEKFIKN